MKHKYGIFMTQVFDESKQLSVGNAIEFDNYDKFIGDMLVQSMVDHQDFSIHRETVLGVEKLGYNGFTLTVKVQHCSPGFMERRISSMVTQAEKVIISDLYISLDLEE